MGEQSGVDVVSMRVADGEKIDIEGISLDAIYTPGHTDDSYSFLMGERVFTGDTLLIRGTGRTDFQNGDPRQQYDSIFNRLLKLPEETLVYPAHDYKGEMVSTIGEEKAFNPRLQVQSVEQYADIMNALDLPNPMMMDVAVPANLHVGLAQDRADLAECSLCYDEVLSLMDKSEAVLVDLRDRAERQRHGVIPGSVHAPYGGLDDHLAPGGLLHELASATQKRLVFYCAYGERSAMAVEVARDAGLNGPCHVNVDATGKMIAVANYGAGSTASFPIKEDGSLGEAASVIQHKGSSVNEARQKGPHAHSVNFSPDNRFVVTADLGTDEIYVFRTDPETGKIEPNDPPAAKVHAGGPF